MSDEELIDLYRNGDENSLKLLFDRYLKSIYRFAFSFTHDDASSSDLTQDIFVKVWKNISKFDSKKVFKTWLYVIAKNTIYDFLKKKKEVLFSDIDSGENTYFETIEDEKLILSDELIDIEFSSKYIKQAIKKLPIIYQTVLLMYYFNELTFNEISEITGESINTVKSRHRRGVQKLKGLIDIEILG